MIFIFQVYYDKNMLNFVYDGKQASMKFFSMGNYLPTGHVGTVKPNNSSYIINIQTTLPFKIQKVTKNNRDALFPLLKSNLQKQVRRQIIEAVATCEIMLELNDFETLRRLCIIAAEDVEITTETSVIAWLMAATSKGYVMSQKDKQFVLMYVTNLVRCSSYIEPDHDERNFSLENIMDSDMNQKEILAGIYLRSCYGGLEGDVPMYINACYHAFCNGLRTFSDIKIPETSLDFHPACVDFHIYPNLCDLISKDTGIDSTIIRKTIWVCSSGINNRKINDNLNDQKIWLMIKRSFDLHTLSYLSKIIKMYF